MNNVMGCPCKKTIKKMVKYDRELINKETGVKTIETVEEEIEVEKREWKCLKWYEKIYYPILDFIKIIGLVALGFIALGLVFIWMTIWFITSIIRKFIFNKESKLNSPFFEYDRIKKKIKTHNEKMRELINSKKEKETNPTINILNG